MIVKVAVSWERLVHDEKLHEDIQHEFTVDMWIDPKDLVTIPNPIDAGGHPSNYKRDVTAMRIDTDERVRLWGCWSHQPGELIADRVIPIMEKDRVKA